MKLRLRAVSPLWETLTIKWQIKEEIQRGKSEKNRAKRIEFEAGRNNVNSKNNNQKLP